MDSESDDEPHSNVVDQQSVSVVNESLNVSAIGTIYPSLKHLPFSSEGPMNSTRISSIMPQNRPPSPEHYYSDNPDDSSFHSVDSSVDSPSKERSEKLQNTLGTQGSVKDAPLQAFPSQIQETWSASLPHPVMSPIADRVRASKLRRSSMFVQIAKEVEDDDSYSDSEVNETDDEEDDSYCDSEVNETGDEDLHSGSRSDEEEESEECSESSVIRSHLVETKPTIRKYKRIVVPSDSDTD